MDKDQIRDDALNRVTAAFLSDRGLGTMDDPVGSAREVDLAIGDAYLAVNALRGLVPTTALYACATQFPGGEAFTYRQQASRAEAEEAIARWLLKWLHGASGGVVSHELGAGAVKLTITLNLTADWEIHVPDAFATLDIYGFHGEVIRIIGSDPPVYGWWVRWVDFGQDRVLASSQCETFDKAVAGAEEAIQSLC